MYLSFELSNPTSIGFHFTFESKDYISKMKYLIAFIEKNKQQEQHIIFKILKNYMHIYK